MAEIWQQFAKERGIQYFLISFTDLFGTQRAKLVPARAIARDGEGRRRLRRLRDLAGHDARRSRHVRDARPASLIQLPWKPEVAGSPPIPGWTASWSRRRRATC